MNVFTAAAKGKALCIDCGKWFPTGRSSHALRCQSCGVKHKKKQQHEKKPQFVSKICPACQQVFRTNHPEIVRKCRSCRCKANRCDLNNGRDDPPPPKIPVNAVPGSELKFRVIAERAASGLGLWHPLDATFSHGS